MFRLFTWDGILPFSVLLVPEIIERLVPNRGAIEIAAVALPIIFFFVRIVTGCRHIDANHCTPGFQRFQVWAMVFGVFILVFIDAILILSHVMPNDAVNNRADWIIFATIIATYFLAMSVAMYPGRSKPLPDVIQVAIDQRPPP